LASPWAYINSGRNSGAKREPASFNMLKNTSGDTVGLSGLLSISPVGTTSQSVSRRHMTFVKVGLPDKSLGRRHGHCRLLQLVYRDSALLPYYREKRHPVPGDPMSQARDSARIHLRRQRSTREARQGDHAGGPDCRR